MQRRLPSCKKILETIKEQSEKGYSVFFITENVWENAH